MNSREIHQKLLKKTTLKILTNLSELHVIKAFKKSLWSLEVY